MIVILSYFMDGSDGPVVEFIEDAPDQAERVARSIAGAHSAGREVEVYKVENLTLPAVRIDIPLPEEE